MGRRASRRGSGGRADFEMQIQTLAAAQHTRSLLLGASRPGRGSGERSCPHPRRLLRSPAPGGAQTLEMASRPDAGSPPPSRTPAASRRLRWFGSAGRVSLGAGFSIWLAPRPTGEGSRLFPLEWERRPRWRATAPVPEGAASAGPSRVCADQQRPAAGAMRLDRAEAAADNEPLERQPTQSTASIAARGPAPPSSALHAFLRPLSHGKGAAGWDNPPAQRPLCLHKHNAKWNYQHLSNSRPPSGAASLTARLPVPPAPPRSRADGADSTTQASWLDEGPPRPRPEPRTRLARALGPRSERQSSRPKCRGR